jgi:hypothetical protein
MRFQSAKPISVMNKQSEYGEMYSMIMNEIRAHIKIKLALVFSSVSYLRVVIKGNNIVNEQLSYHMLTKRNILTKARYI